MCEIDWKIVPDWIQAISSLGGIVALWFLWKTLKTQNYTLLEQQNLTKLENNIFRNSTMPFIVAEEYINLTDVNDPDSSKPIVSKYVFKVKGNLLCKLEIVLDEKHSNKDFRNVIVGIDDKKLYNVDDKITITSTISMLQKIKHITPETVTTYDVYYEDNYNEKYTQRIIIRRNNDFYITNPTYTQKQ